LKATNPKRRKKRPQGPPQKKKGASAIGHPDMPNSKVKMTCNADQG